MQGRLFLSARIIGFHANLFGHKTKFFFLWEDIEDIQEIPPSLASVGSPSIIIVLRRGRGMDAKHGAKAQDLEGRLKFHFQSFVSFHSANRYQLDNLSIIFSSFLLIITDIHVILHAVIGDLNAGGSSLCTFHK